MATKTKGAVQKVELVQVEGLVSVSTITRYRVCQVIDRKSREWRSRDVQVALKIIKHCQEEGSSTEVVNGFLVGLVVGDTLEVTNCFPLPKSLSSLEDESQYERLFLKSVDVD